MIKDRQDLPEEANVSTSLFIVPVDGRHSMAVLVALGSRFRGVVSWLLLTLSLLSFRCTLYYLASLLKLALWNLTRAGIRSRRNWLRSFDGAWVS